MRSAKYVVGFVFLIGVLLYLGGCSSFTRLSSAGSVTWYSTPVREFQKPASSVTQELSARQIRKVTAMIRRVEDWQDDTLVNRPPFTFDGELNVYDTLYYFSYGDSILYYRHFYGRIDPEDIELIKSLA